MPVIRSRLGELLEPFTTWDRAATIRVSRQEVGRWRSGARIPASGPNVRAIAKALVGLLERDGLPGTDLAEAIREVVATVAVDRKARCAASASDSFKRRTAAS